jgi:hypothetical protein
MLENLRFVNRIKNKTSNYSVKQWKNDRKSQEKLIKNISEYPKCLNKTNRKFNKSAYRYQFSTDENKYINNGLPKIKFGLKGK